MNSKAPSSAANSGVASAVIGPQPWQFLQPGMAAPQVEGIMGKPSAVKRVAHAEADSERWIYRRELGSTVDFVSPKIFLEPWIDPITNEMKMLPVPLQSVQRTDWFEVVEVEFVAGSVTSIERMIDDRRGFSD